MVGAARKFMQMRFSEGKNRQLVKRSHLGQPSTFQDHENKIKDKE